MRISKVIIKNYRNFRDFEVRLGRNIVLLGENAAGKTNFLEALRLALDPSFRAQIGDSDFSNGVTKFRGTEIEVRIQFTDFIEEKDRDFLSLVPGCFIQDNPPVAQIAFLYCPRYDVENLHEATGPDYYQTIRYGGNLIEGSPPNEEAARRFRQYARLKVIPALRDIERDMSVWRYSPLRRLVEAMDLSSNPRFYDVADHIREATEDLRNIPPVVELQEKIQRRLVEMIEGIIQVDPMIGLLPTGTDELQRMLTFFVEEELSLDRASLGLANVLYFTLLMVELELDRSEGRNNEYRYTILAIEEPEAHLHPHLQRLVFHDFLRSDVPIVLSTHSPNIVSVSEPDWFVLMKRRDGGTEAASTNELERLPSFLKRDLSRYLDATRGEVVFAKAIILVEGDAEVFLISEFARKMRDAGEIPFTLDGAGVSVCSVSGTDFTPYVYFFGPYGLNLPLAVITDGDKYVGLSRQTANLLKKNSLRKIHKEALQKVHDNGELEHLRNLLEQHDAGWFEGLNRGIKLVKHLDREKAEYLRTLYDRQKWADVRAGLTEIGIFVNDWTLEAELINVGYGDELIEVYKELGASKTKQQKMDAALLAIDVEGIMSRIEETGKGKGRFAQRLADKTDADRVPAYIRDAISFAVIRGSMDRTTQRPAITANDTE